MPHMTFLTLKNNKAGGGRMDQKYRCQLRISIGSILAGEIDTLVSDSLICVHQIEFFFTEFSRLQLLSLCCSLPLPSPLCRQRALTAAHDGGERKKRFVDGIHCH
ncbi:hypothetical protein AMECASPLE_033764 [Ameca splendens]|uniref:Uncharacterized protein n=1 Tax=Ameca splendens TaxID=208324 RepID=A0ABV0XJX8_9TELE